MTNFTMPHKELRKKFRF